MRWRLLLIAAVLMAARLGPAPVTRPFATNAAHANDVRPVSSVPWNRFYRREVAAINRLGEEMDALTASSNFVGTHAARLLLNPVLYPLRAYFESDRGYCEYVSDGVVWRYVAGQMSGTIDSPDQKPADLGAGDAGFLFRCTEAFNRIYRWSGSAWADAPGQPARSVEWFMSAPPATHHVCDGSAGVSISTPTGGVATVTVPNLQGDTFLRGAAAYSGPAADAAVAPTLSGSATGSNTNSIDLTHNHGIDVDTLVGYLDHYHYAFSDHATPANGVPVYYEYLSALMVCEGVSVVSSGGFADCGAETCTRVYSIPAEAAGEAWTPCEILTPEIAVPYDAYTGPVQAWDSGGSTIYTGNATGSIGVGALSVSVSLAGGTVSATAKPKSMALIPALRL